MSVARIRLQTGRCPHCGWEPDRHDRSGGPGNCPMTDKQVRAAVAKFVAFFLWLVLR